MNHLFTRLEVFTDLMGCVGNLNVWHYDADLQLIESNCQEEAYWNGIFITTCSAPAQKHCKSSSRPVLIGGPIEILWIAFPVRKDDCLQEIFVLGPVFLSVLAEAQVNQILTKRGMSAVIKKEFINYLKGLPIVPHTTFLLLGTMLHFCLTSERISISDIQISMSETDTIPFEYEDLSQDIHGGAEYESLVLKLIEEGNLDYKNVLSGLSSGRVGTLAPGNSLRQFKNEIISAIILYSRAAVRGGLSREQALTLSDYYIQLIEASSTIAEVATCNYTMHEDFIQRVHKFKQQRLVPPVVKACINYIDCHITQKLNITDIAKQIGYSGYYISEVFKKEMSVGIRDYIKEKKVEYAKTLLKNSSDDISKISERLCFSSVSYFSRIFRDYTGMNPKEYRDQ